MKNQILFAACGHSGNPPATPPQPMMLVITERKGRQDPRGPCRSRAGSDGAVFNPNTMEAFSTHGNGTMTVVKENSPTSFVVEENLTTMNGARTVTLDSKTGHLFAMAQETGPAPAPTTPPAPGGRGPARGAVIPGSFTILMIGK